MGAARQIKNMGLDVDDPVLNKEDFQEDVLYESSLETRRDESRMFRKQYQADREEQEDLAKRKIVHNNMFGKTVHPHLLTWLEKEMIRHLHRLILLLPPCSCLLLQPPCSFYCLLAPASLLLLLPSLADRTLLSGAKTD